MKKLSKLILAFALVVLFSAVAQAEGMKPKTFVVVTSAETEVQGMAMVLSMQAIKNGADVRVLLCGSGGDMALKSAESKMLKPKNISPRQMMQKVMSMGATVEVCALYMPNRGLGMTDLVEGVGMAKPPAIGVYMADPKVRYFTF